MDTRFLEHNTHLESAKNFAKRDPHLRRLQTQHFVYEFPLLNELPINKAGVYTLSGGRQIGKTTLLKQWMAKLLAHGIPAESIVFFSGELIDDFHVLLRLLQEQLAQMPKNRLRYVLLDEVTYIRDWDKAIKYAADVGLLDNVALVVTGSDLVVIQEARMRFPGRRGREAKVDFHLYPMSFAEVVQMKKIIKGSVKDFIKQEDFSEKIIDALFIELQNYLRHGGYLTAINDIAMHGYIAQATLNTYSDWVRGDILKRGKQEHYLREILLAIIKRYGSQLTWHALARDLSIDHHKTVADYVELLCSMDALFVQSALLEDKLVAAPKKARKIMFLDPFIFHAIRSWLVPVENAYQNQISPTVEDPEWSSKLVEACVASHYHRFYPTYYIKSDGEVDIAYVEQNRFLPIEIKWTNQLRANEFKQILKYPNARILTKRKQFGIIEGIRSEPLPVALLKVGIT